jgi:nicotinate-nucleotide adenylyltransferase
MGKQHRKIGISGGTFDPIHYGHLIIAQEAGEILGLERVIFIPSGNPPHKTSQKVTSAYHRYKMVKKAIENNPFFDISDIEIKKEGYSYTVDTLQELIRIHGNYTKFYFITGADVVRELDHWKDFEKIFKMCEFVAALRQGYDKEALIDRIDYLKKHYNAKIHMVNTPLIGISSTIIRNMIGKNKSIKYLVPEKVEKYIIENNLYKD